MRRRHLLLDLDGTLLGLDIEQFLPAYMAELAAFVERAEILNNFSTRFAAAVQAMLAPRTQSMTNEEAFYRRFYQGLEDGVRRRLDDAVRRFYRDAYPALRRLAAPVAGARELVDGALAQGWRLTLATSPVFPRPAIVERLHWAGLDEAAFNLVTGFEICHYVKPDERYYAEVAALLGADRREMLMIGNDRVDDGAAARAGIPVALVQGAFARGEDDGFSPFWQGTLQEMATRIGRGDWRCAD